MKNSFPIIFLLFNLFLLGSCFEDECQLRRTYIKYEPVYFTIEQIRSSVELQSAADLRHPGKIYVFGSYLLVNELKEGIHIFDNSNPSNPLEVNFIKIPGNVDMSVRDGMLYADNYIDLLTIDISDPKNPKLLCRSESVFTPINVDARRGLLVDYKQTPETLTLDCNSPNYGIWTFFEGDVLFDSNIKTSGPNRNAPGSFTGVAGVGGSMARFTIADDFLYVVDQSDLFSFEVSAICPQLKNKTQVGWNIETIYPYENNLFIGSTSGMFIYTIKNPSTPTYAGNLQHIRSCDPVVAQGNYAYVTLHGGSACGGFTNQLDIVDVQNIFNPVLLKSVELEYPLGLGVNGDYLYICDNALKVFKLTQPDEVILKTSVALHNPYDVIVLSNLNQLILTGESGIYQYDISDQESPGELSLIPAIK